MIEASLTHALKTDSATLASWRQAKRTTVKGVVSRGAVSGAPVVVGGGSPGIGGGSLATGAVPAAIGSGSVSASAVPAANSQVSVVNSVGSPDLSTVPVVASQESKAA
jgi:hypothetical protein